MFAKLADAFGLTIPVSGRTILGAPGTAIWGGYPETKETNAELVGERRWLTYSDLLTNVSIVAAATRHFLNLVAKAGWKFVPPDGSGAEGQRIADACQIALSRTRTPWHQIVRRTSMFRLYGFSMQEWVTEPAPDKNGILGFWDVLARPQSTIERWYRNDLTDEIDFVVQRAPQDNSERVLPRAKLVYAVDASLDDNPEGLGLLRQVAEPCRRLRVFEQLEGVGFQGDLSGTPIVRAPLAKLDALVRDGTITAEERTARLTPLRQFVTKHVKNPALGLLLESLTYSSQDDSANPSTVKQYDVELMKSESSTQEEVAASIERINREIARVFGIEGILLGATGTGSFAMSRDKSQTFALIIATTLQELGEVYERDLLVPLAIYNGWPQHLLPKMKTDPVQHREVGEVTAALKEMAGAGAVLAPDDPVINSVRDMLGMPHATIPKIEVAPAEKPKPESTDEEDD